MTWLIVSLSERISARFFVPNTFRNVVAARRRVEWLEKRGLILTVVKSVWKWLKVPVVLNVVGGHRGVGHSIVDDGVHTYCHGITGEDLEKGIKIMT